jgi:hypothetical protein
MGTVNSDESRLRGRDLGGAENKNSVDHVDEKRRNPDTSLRTDGEEDTLYDDGLDIKDDSQPLTGVDGKDDSVSRQKRS